MQRSKQPPALPPHRDDLARLHPRRRPARDQRGSGIGEPSLGRNRRDRRHGVGNVPGDPFCAAVLSPCTRTRAKTEAAALSATQEPGLSPRRVNAAVPKAFPHSDLSPVEWGPAGGCMAPFREAVSVDPRADLAWERRSILTAPSSGAGAWRGTPPCPRGNRRSCSTSARGRRPRSRRRWRS